MASYQTVRYERRGRAVWIWLNRPEKRNALNLQIVEELTEALREAEGAPEARSVVLTGEGTVFCAGLDLQMALDLDHFGYRRFQEALGAMWETVRWLSRPVILRANGDGYGAGAVFLGACDITIAVKSARFALREVNVGLQIGGVFLFDIGRARALDLALTGRAFTAEEGERWGLVTRAVGPEDLDRAVQEYVDTFASLPPLAVSATKRSMNLLLDLAGFGPHRRALADTNGLLFSSEDRREAMQAFFQKREPTFRGR